MARATFAAQSQPPRGRRYPFVYLALSLALPAMTGCGNSAKGPIMTVKDVAYNTVVAGDGHAAITIYFSNQPTLCEAESRAERLPNQVVAVALLEGESSNHMFKAGSYPVQPTDPRAVVTLDTYDANCTLIPGGDGASSGSIGVDADPNDSSLPLTVSLTFAQQGQTLDGQFNAAFCPSLVDASVTYHCPM